MPEVLPIPVEVLRLALRERSSVTDLAGTRIGVELGGSEPSVRLSHVGGPTGWGEGSPLVLVECWGRANAPDDGSAATLAQRIAAEVETLRGEYAGGWLAGAGVEGGPADSPDPRSSRPRVQLTVRLATYPL